jgi:hypothetical protein
MPRLQLFARVLRRTELIPKKLDFLLRRTLCSAIREFLLYPPLVAQQFLRTRRYYFHLLFQVLLDLPKASNLMD